MRNCVFAEYKHKIIKLFEILYELFKYAVSHTHTLTYAHTHISFTEFFHLPYTCKGNIVVCTRVRYMIYVFVRLQYDIEYVTRRHTHFCVPERSRLRASDRSSVEHRKLMRVLENQERRVLDPGPTRLTNRTYIIIRRKENAPTTENRDACIWRVG